MLCEQFSNLLNSVTFAADRETGFRYSLKCVQITSNGATVACATDGRRLAYRTLDDAVLPEGEYLIGLKDAKTLATRLGRQTAAGSVVVDVANGNTGKTAMFRWRSRKKESLNVELLEGRFPKWADVIVPQSDVSGSLSGTATELLSFIPDPFSVGFDFNLDKRLCEYQSRQFAKNRVTGSGITTLDPVLVRDWLQTLPDDCDCELQFHGADSAVICSAANGSNYVLMPKTRD